MHFVRVFIGGISVQLRRSLRSGSLIGIPFLDLIFFFLFLDLDIVFGLQKSKNLLCTGSLVFILLEDKVKERFEDLGDH